MKAHPFNPSTPGEAETGLSGLHGESSRPARLESETLSQRGREGRKEGLRERYFLGETTQCVHIAEKGVVRAKYFRTKGRDKKRKGFW